MNMTALDWSSDGKWLVTSEGFDGGGSRHLILISTADGSSQAITNPPAAVTGDVEARFSPDSQRVAFRRGGQGTLFVLSLAGNSAWQPRQITQLNSGVRGIAWSPDGQRIYFGSQQKQGHFSLWSVPAGGGAPSPAIPGNEGVSPALNPNHHLIAFSQQQIDQNLWLYSLDPLHRPQILVPSTAVESAPAFSPDGKGFAFVSSRSGALEVWVSAIDGVRPRRITAMGDAKVIETLSWSPDGSSVVFSARRQGRDGAWQSSVATGATTALRQSDTYSNWPQLSAEGDSLYFVSNAGQRFRIWRQLANRPETAEPLIPETVTSFRLSTDRRSLYFIRRSTQTLLIRLNLITHEEDQLFAFPEMPSEISAWDVSAGRLFYVTLDSRRCVASVICVALSDGKGKIVGEFPVRSVEGWQAAITAASDRGSVIVTQTDREDSRIMAARLR